MPLLAAAILATACSDDQTTAPPATDADRPDVSDADAGDTGEDADVARDADVASDPDPDADATPNPFGVPLLADSPWPKFRYDVRQTGATPLLPSDDSRELWSFETGKGIFSSPVIGADGAIYIGSADRNFYCLEPDGEERWSFPTGEIIDSSALLDDSGRVYFGSGDGHVYALAADTGSFQWSFEADEPTPPALINWFEGNVAMGPDGTLIAGNDNFTMYGIERGDGSLAWRTTMPDQTWSLPAIDLDLGRMFVGNNNLAGLGANMMSFDLAGRPDWNDPGTATIAASPMITPNGLVIAGAYDGFMRAYSSRNGDIVFEFPTRDHIYASPAWHPDGFIIQPSADGTVYAIDLTGEQFWAFDWGAPMRSSPAIDGHGNVYIGTGDGHLLVLNRDGTLRWALELIADDRDDLNGSPAIGHHAIYLAGESGEVFGVPYDFCLRDEEQSSPACTIGPDEPLAAEGVLLRFTTNFGTALDEPPAAIDANQPLVFTLDVREGGDTTLAFIDAESTTVTVAPESAMTTEVSANRRFLTVIPDDGWLADEAGELRVEIAGDYLIDGSRDGLVFSGGDVGGQIDAVFDLSLAPAEEEPFELIVPEAPGDDGTVWELHRLAVPLPTLLPSYNQIGFDSLHFLVGLVEQNDDTLIGWFVEGAPIGVDDAVIAVPGTRGMFPFVIDYEGGLLTASNEGGLALEVMSAVIDFDTFRVSARLGADGGASAAATVHATSLCSGIQLYGPFIRALGLCNPDTDLITAFGAFLLEPYDGLGGGGVQSAPTGLGDVAFSGSDTSFRADLTGSSLRLDEHSFALLLIDAETNLPLSLDYGPDMRTTASDEGIVESVSIPVDLDGDWSVRAYLMVDTYPAAVATLAP